MAGLLGQAHEGFCLQVDTRIPEGEPRSGVVPDRAQGPAVAQPASHAAPLRQEGLQLLPPDLRPALWPQAAQEGVGGRRSEAEVDPETGEKFTSFKEKLLEFVYLLLNQRL